MNGVASAAWAALDTRPCCRGRSVSAGAAGAAGRPGVGCTPVLLRCRAPPRRHRASHRAPPPAAVVASAPSAAAPSASPFPYGAALEQGLRGEQEDALAVLPLQLGASDDVALYAAVFDGHGGSAAAAFLQRELHGAVQRAVAKEPPGTFDSMLALAPVLTAAFEATDTELLAHLQTHPDVAEAERFAGSTATVALVAPGRVVLAHCGDSRAVLCRRSGAALEVTRDHRPSGRALGAQAEAARVAATGAWVADGRVMGVLAVSRAFGDYEFKAGREAFLASGASQGLWPAAQAEGRVLSAAPVVVTPEVNEVPTDGGAFEFLLLASDGLWDSITSVQACQFVRAELGRNGRDAAAAAAKLAEHAVKRRRSQDNVAAVLVLLT